MALRQRGVPELRARKGAVAAERARNQSGMASPVRVLAERIAVGVDDHIP